MAKRNCLHCGKPCGRRFYCSDAHLIYCKVDTIDPSKCWEWQGALLSKRLKNKMYGTITLYRDGKQKTILAHRLSYLTFVGPITAPMLLHSCHNSKCVNPNHLSPGTAAENIEDKKKAGRSRLGGYSKLTADDVKFIRQSKQTKRQLAAMFNIHPDTIYDVRSRKTWRHI